jgi:hypothetical protein
MLSVLSALDAIGQLHQHIQCNDAVIVSTNVHVRSGMKRLTKKFDLVIFFDKFIFTVNAVTPDLSRLLRFPT